MSKGIIAAGHELTLSAAEEILREGGNAYDAAIAAFFAACLAEPVLASPGGGGFLLAKSADTVPCVYDFFVQTPKHKHHHELDFVPVLADFGEAKQEFHIGLASIAVPGAVRGLFQVHKDLGSMPLRELVAPAMIYAQQGIKINPFQSYILDVVEPIFSYSSEAEKIYASSSQQGLLKTDDVFKPEKLADTLEMLAIEGDRLFYQGEIAQAIVESCEQGGGLINRQDLHDYQCIKRLALVSPYRNGRIITNPPPSSGGILIAFALKLLEQFDLHKFSHDSYDYLKRLVLSMHYTQTARLDQSIKKIALDQLLDENLLEKYGESVSQRAKSYRGTTHISIIDKSGNMAALTLSNGEGCGYMLSDTGIMLNNMLGEQDLNPHGFFQWQTDQRMTSMMAPSLLLMDDGRHVVTGSGGSNRIRTALMQVIINLIDFSMPIDQAVSAPRLHYEDEVLNIEGLFSPDVIEQLTGEFRDHQVWPQRNLFFGGVHSVMQQGNHFSGMGDPRRGGVCRQII